MSNNILQQNQETMKQILLTFIMALIAQMALGQIFVDQSATGNDDGSSWADAYTELSTAIEIASEGSEIWVAEGTYFPDGSNATRESTFFLDLNVQIYGGFEGTEASLSERGDYNDHPTILSGDINGDDIPDNFTDNRSDNCMHIMWTDTTITNETVIDGFFFQNGHTDDGDGSGNDRRAGAILSYGAPIIQNCSFTQNYGYFAGAVYPRGEFATGFRILDCDFYNNMGRSGGCIYIVSLDAGLVENCTFENNDAVFGAGIYNASSSDTIRNCVFTNNNAGPDGRGAGIYNTQVFTVIEGCQFSDNTAPDRTGSGIHFTSSDNPTEAFVRNCTFERSEADFGGAVSVYGEDTEVSIGDCDFNFNTAFTNGGALTVGFGATANLMRCNFSENEANFGGALFMQNDNSKLNIDSSTFISNISEVSGGVLHTFAGVDISISHSLFESNSTSPSGGSGGAFNLNEDSLDLAQVRIEKSRFIGNFGNEEGGAIRLQNFDAHIENCVFAFNMTGVDGSGGAIINNGAFRGESIGAPLRLVNNTFALNQGGEADAVLVWEDPQGQASVSLQNNAFHQLGGVDIGIQDGDPEIISTGGNLSLNTSADLYLDSNTDILGSDPLFVDLNTLDFGLQEESPCIDNGEPDDAPDEDIEGNERDDMPDIGAYEYTGTVSADIPNAFRSDLHVFPSVTSDDINIHTRLDATPDRADISIFDTQGRRVLDRQLSPNGHIIQEKMRLGTLNAGTYFVQLSIDGQQQTAKVIKK